MQDTNTKTEAIEEEAHSQTRDFIMAFQFSWQLHIEENKPLVVQGTVCPCEHEKTQGMEPPPWVKV